MSHDHKCKKRLYCSPMIAQSRVWLVTLEGNKICRIRASVDIVTNQRCSHSNEACHFMSNLFLNKLDFCRRIIVCHDSKEHPLNFWRATIFYSNNRCVRKFSSIIMWKDRFMRHTFPKVHSSHRCTIWLLAGSRKRGGNWIAQWIQRTGGFSPSGRPNNPNNGNCK